MLRLAFAVIATFIATQAHASFGYVSCSNPESTITYKYRFIYSNPVETDVWTIDGKEYSPRAHYAPGAGPDSDLLEPTITTEDLSARHVFESTDNMMSATSVYSYKVKLTYQNENAESTSVEAWLICNSGSGI